MEYKATVEKVIIEDDWGDDQNDWYLKIGITVGAQHSEIICHSPYTITPEEWQAIIDGKILRTTQYYECSIELDVHNDTYTFDSKSERECITTTIKTTIPRSVVAPALARALGLQAPECDTIKGDPAAQ